MIDNFVREIEGCLVEVPEAQWKDPTLCGLVYDFMPWHKYSNVTLQTTEDRIDDIGAWKYYYSAESSVSWIQAEIQEYETGTDAFRYHRLLLEAAEALLRIDFSRFLPNIVTNENFRLYGPFRVQIYDPDQRYQFNYLRLHSSAAFRQGARGGSGC